MAFEKRRKKYQVFTPEKTVRLMLNEIGYYGVDIIDKTIVDISCGDGAFLREALVRYIEACKNSGIPDNEIFKMANDHIFGYEIDPIFYNECQNRMEKIARDASVKNKKIAFSNIYNADGLKIDSIHFDFVVGNPPYLSYKEMDLDKRKYLKDNFATCKESKYDYSYAFIEKSIELLNDDGLAAIIAPINMYRIKSGRLMREYLCNKLFKIIDVTEEKIFPRVLTNPVISLFKKNNDSVEIEYIKADFKTKIPIISFYNNEFSKRSSLTTGTKRFGDYYSIHNGVATLLNSAFIVPKETDIEKTILKNAVSFRGIRYGAGSKIIFPYKIKKGKIFKYKEEYFKKTFPKAYVHLLKNKTKLFKRNSDSNAQWFEYGRSQALSMVLTKKVIVPAIMSEKMKAYILDADDIVYAGFFIVSKEPRYYSLENAVKILSSKELYDYICKVGIKMNGKSYRYSVKDLENYTFK